MDRSEHTCREVGFFSCFKCILLTVLFYCQSRDGKLICNTMFWNFQVAGLFGCFKRTAEYQMDLLFCQRFGSNESFFNANFDLLEITINNEPRLGPMRKSNVDSSKSKSKNVIALWTLVFIGKAQGRTHLYVQC